METTFYEGPGVTVTQTRFVSGRETYAIAGITSVSVAREPTLWTGPALLIIAGVAAWASSSWMIGVPAVAVGVLWGLLQPRDWVVSIRTASGEVKALTDRSEKRVQAVVDAVSRAIVARG